MLPGYQVPAVLGVYASEGHRSQFERILRSNTPPCLSNMAYTSSNSSLEGRHGDYTCSFWAEGEEGGSQFESAVHHGQWAMSVGTRGNWSHWVYNQEAERVQWQCSICSPPPIVWSEHSFHSRGSTVREAPWPPQQPMMWTSSYAHKRWMTKLS